jgi:hypothetical protein
VVFYELLTGQLPFRGTLLAVMAQIMTQDVVPPRRLRADLDPRIEAVCLKMMAKHPQDRFSSMSAVADELEKILRNPPAKAGSDATPVAAPVAPAAPFVPTAQNNSAAKTVIIKGRPPQTLASLKSKAWEASDLASLEEVARKSIARGNYEQAIEVIECVPENRRSPKLQALWASALGRADEVASMICELDEMVRLGDQPAATRVAERLLELQPGHRRAQNIREELATRGKTVSRRTVSWESVARRWNKSGPIRWIAPALGLAFFAATLYAGVLYFRSGKALLEVRIDDPNVEVSVKGSTVVLKAPGQEIEVQPGETELAIRLGELHFTTNSFTLKRGDKTTVKVALADSKLAATLGEEVLGAQPLGKPSAVPPSQEAPVASAKATVVKKAGDRVPATTKASPPPRLTDRKEYKILSGDWHLEGDYLVQSDKRPSRVIVFGDVRWTDYDFTVDAMRMGRGDSFALFFRWADRETKLNQLTFDIAGSGNRKAHAFLITDGRSERVQERDIRLVGHRWYTARVKVRGGHFECFLNDGDKDERLIVFDDDRHPKGCVALRTWNSVYRFRNIKVTAPDGTVLWEGLPEIP